MLFVFGLKVYQKSFDIPMTVLNRAFIIHIIDCIIM